MKRRLGSNMNIGASSLLLIFIVLSLITFAIMTLSEALTNKQLIRRSLDNTTAYYTACNAAEVRLSELATTSTTESVSFNQPINEDSSRYLHVSALINRDEGTYSILEWKVITKLPQLDTSITVLQ